MLKLYGIDFTSAPRKAKPIVCVMGSLQAAGDGDTSAEGMDEIVNVKRIEYWTDFDDFEAFLKSEGPWLAGMDFPFGLPVEFLRRTNTATKWPVYVAEVAKLSKTEFTEWLEEYSRHAKPGEKHLFRKTDRLTSACSPMMVYGVPVAKMFYEGARRLLETDVSVLPCRRTTRDGIAIETYPALIARQVIGRESYKGTKREHRGRRIAARKKLLNAVMHNADSDSTGLQSYGLRLKMTDRMAEMMLSDATGDTLDAALCCLQTAWASRQAGYGIPATVESDEGWIVAPTASSSSRNES